MRSAILSELPCLRALPRSVALAFVLFTTSGCWVGQNSAATAEYARQVSTATLRVAQLETELAKSQQRIEQLEDVIRVQGQSEASRLENIDEVNTEVARLRGQIEVIQFQLDDMKLLVEATQIGTERRQLHDEKRLAQIESFLGVKPPPPPTDAEMGILPGEGTALLEPTTPEPPPAELPATAAGKLEVAIEHMEAGRQGVARAVLQRAMNEHAGDSHMAEIRYRYAETFLNEEKWRPAILEFKKVSDNHPDSDFSCWAYYRQGEAMEKVSGINDARLFYSGATAGHCKNSDAGKAAKKKL